MKTYILLFAFLSFSAFGAVGKVPMSWLTSNLELESEKSLMDENNDLRVAYQNILDTKSELFDALPTPQGKWGLQSIRTELAVEAEGTLGVMGAGGEAAVDLIWIRKQGTQVPLRPVAIADEPEVVITGEMTPENVLEEIRPVVNLALAEKFVRGRGRLTQDLFREALKFQKTVRELESAPQMGPWYAYKYQLELFVSAEGKIAFVSIGNSLRIRLEWWRIQKKNHQPFHPPLVPKTLSANAQFVADLASDMASIQDTTFDNGFRLSTLKVGVGASVEGNLFLVKSKATAIGSIFFKRDEVAPSLDPLALTGTHYKTLEGNIPRYSFRRGMQKGAAIAKFFAEHAAVKPEGRFELDDIEIELNLYGNGSVGLTTVEGKSVLTFFVTRNIII